MFNNLRNKIILITMTATTAVLILAGSIIMFFSSTMRPTPEPKTEPVLIDITERNDGTSIMSIHELDRYIKTDREEGNIRLFITLLGVGIAIEIIVFIITYYSSKKIVDPVKASYDKQKLFIANASHELKTPLAVIQANVEALEVNKSNQKWKNNIENEITHANKLVLDLLQLARMDAESMAQNHAEVFNLSSELQSHIDSFKPKFSGKITFKSLTKSKSYHLPKQDILQIFDILLDNAIKYGDKKISISLTDKIISVTNDGTIIKKADFEKIFDRFYQVDKTKSGSGLGLAIASAICKQNNWNIHTESDKHTTTFTITFSNPKLS